MKEKKWRGYCLWFTDHYGGLPAVGDFWDMWDQIEAGKRGLTYESCDCQEEHKMKETSPDSSSAFWDSVKALEFHASPLHWFLKIQGGNVPSQVVEIIVQRGPDTDKLFAKSKLKKLIFKRVGE